MKPDIVLDIKELYGQPILAGAGNGQEFLSILIGRLPNDRQSILVALDLRRVDIVTASFFRTAFRALRDYVRSMSVGSLVFMNANNTTREEIELYADSTNDVFILAAFDKQGEIETPRLAGRIDDKQARALQALLDYGEAHAAELCTNMPEVPPVSPSAWNNRLTALAAKGIVIERSEGRLKKYRPILGGIRYGA